MVALAIACRPFVAALPERVRRLATRGALLFVVGALGLEMVGVVLFIEALMTYMAIRGYALTIGVREASRADWRPGES